MHNVISKVVVFSIYLAARDKYMGKSIDTTILVLALDLIRQKCRANLWADLMSWQSIKFMSLFFIKVRFEN